MKAGHVITATVYRADGEPQTIQAFTTATPGLIVHESLGDPGWVVTHQRSGMSVCVFDGPHEAQGFASAVADACDFTQPGESIQSSVRAKERIVQEARRFNYAPTAGEQNQQARTERLTA